ncbi:BON domain-containing protein [Eoetvoesiella caeni]|uniref:BON domain-containing protein n=1 Tax=Eoetvoesiella caeni TaxID=645616 RepID=A0A366HIX1_9BURK|nr:BON domain-containing protein [Eoetvoesiella caeni]MCI2807682.1 BON domain-containing protein [Eoetvoesiella caeni]NYT52923.1 BON domain-containing protein [Eoetvoesiella caeni]RBP42900.1 BON domain-containing protein [Eoetvoesiella caeni]
MPNDFQRNRRNFDYPDLDRDPAENRGRQSPFGREQGAYQGHDQRSYDRQAPSRARSDFSGDWLDQGGEYGRYEGRSGNEGDRYDQGGYGGPGGRGYAGGDNYDRGASPQPRRSQQAGYLLEEQFTPGEDYGGYANRILDEGGYGRRNPQRHAYEPANAFRSQGGPQSNLQAGGNRGFEANRPQEHYSAPRSMPKGYKRSDERIREDVCEQLSRSGCDVSDVSVDVSDGKVTLQGTVTDRYAKHAIEDCADDCMGVQEVDNRIRVQTQAGNSAASLPRERKQQ